MSAWIMLGPLSLLALLGPLVSFLLGIGGLTGLLGTSARISAFIPAAASAPAIPGSLSGRRSSSHGFRVCYPAGAHLLGYACLDGRAGVLQRHLSCQHWIFLELPMPLIRRACLRDAGMLSALAEATFRATFGAMNTAEHMAIHCRGSYGEEIQAAQIADPGMVTLLCEHEGSLIGYAQLRWGEAPGCISAQRPGEIQRLYVTVDWHGKGVAQELMRACIQVLQQRGSDTLWLGVWEHNPRAISFYEKFGFVAVGEHMFPLGGDLQRDITMARAAGP